MKAAFPSSIPAPLKLVFTAGVFDLLHRGHINLLEKMREAAGPDGHVIVVLHDDRSTWINKHRVPIQSWNRRANCLRVTGLMDEIRRCDEPSPAKWFRQIIAQYRKRELLFIRGDDWEDFPGRNALDEERVKVELIGYTKGVSTTLLREQMLP